MKFVIQDILMLFIVAFFCLLIVAITNSTEGYEPTVQHRNMQLDGYNYCPYCGEYLKDSKD